MILSFPTTTSRVKNVGVSPVYEEEPVTENIYIQKSSKLKKYLASTVKLLKQLFKTPNNDNITK